MVFQDTGVQRPSDLFGGPRGMIDSGLPPIVFVLVNFARGLGDAVWAAVAVGAVLLLVRVLRREHVRHAVSGFFGVAIAAGIARLTGEAKNFFLPSIVINAVYSLAFLGSAFTRQPLIGLILKLFSEKPAAYHEHPTVRRAYRDATLGWAGLFLLRVVVKETLRQAGKTGWLAVAHFGMGYPLFLGALALTLRFIAWRTGGVVVADDPHPEEEPLPHSPFESEPHH